MRPGGRIHVLQAFYSQMQQVKNTIFGTTGEGAALWLRGSMAGGRAVVEDEACLGVQIFRTSLAK